MIINVLERDRGAVEIGSFKLKEPYTKLIEGAITAAKTELRETNSYARRNNMKVIKGKTMAHSPTTHHSFFIHYFKIHIIKTTKFTKTT